MGLIRIDDNIGLYDVPPFPLSLSLLASYDDQDYQAIIIDLVDPFYSHCYLPCLQAASPNNNVRQPTCIIIVIIVGFHISVT